MTYRFWKYSFAVALALGMASSSAVVAQDTAAKPAEAPAVTKQVSPEQLALETEAVKAAKQLSDAFNAGNSDAVAAVFLPDGELIDDSGTVHLGHNEIKALVKAWYTYIEEKALLTSICNKSD